eukprot:6717569-Prymnesium_polylepis.1
MVHAWRGLRVECGPRVLSTKSGSTRAGRPRAERRDAIHDLEDERADLFGAGARGARARGRVVRRAAGALREGSAERTHARAARGQRWRARQCAGRAGRAHCVSVTVGVFM